MIAAKSFTEILALRGRIVLFTASAAVALPLEQVAERQYFQIVTVRGWADIYGPISQWRRLHDSREHGLISCDIRSFGPGVRLPATDVVWVGETGDVLHVPHLWQLFTQAMARSDTIDETIAVRKWLLSEGA